MATIHLPDNLAQKLHHYCEQHGTDVEDLLRQWLDSEERFASYQAIFENSRDGIFLTRAGDFRFLDANPAGCEIFGYTKQELLQMTALDVVAPTGSEQIEKDNIVFKSDGFIKAEYRVKRKDGHIIHVESFAVQNILPGTNMSIVRDITERKQREIFLGTIFRESHSAIFIINVDENGVFTFGGINPADERATGLRNDDVVGKRPDEVEALSPEMAESLKVNYQRCVDAGVPITYEECFYVSGREVWWLTQLTPLRDAEGRIFQIIGNSLEITDRKMLRVNQQFLDVIFEESEIDIAIVDVEGHNSFRVVRINPTFLKFSPLEPEDVLGKNFQEIEKLPEADREKQIKNYQRCVDSGHSITYEESFTHEGVENWLVTQLTPLVDEQNQVKRIVSLSLDITDAKRFQQELRRRELTELELRKERELREFQSAMLTMISHEFRTPLSVIQTSVELLRRHPRRTQSDYLTEKLDRIETSLRRLTEMVDMSVLVGDEILKRHDVSTIPINVANTLDRFIDEANTRVEQQRSVQVQLEGKPMCKIDEYLLRQIVLNVLTNALKYTTESGQVTIHGQHLGQVLTLTISDDGIGIPEAEVAHVFKPFYRASNAEFIPGVGLGLTIARQAIDVLGGDVTLESQSGKGTKVTLRIPTNR